MESPDLRNACAVDRRESLARHGEIAEATFGFAARVIGVESAIHELPHGHVEVELQLVIHGVFDASAASVNYLIYNYNTAVHSAPPALAK